MLYGCYSAVNVYFCMLIFITLTVFIFVFYSYLFLSCHVRIVITALQISCGDDDIDHQLSSVIICIALVTIRTDIKQDIKQSKQLQNIV